MVIAHVAVSTIIGIVTGIIAFAFYKKASTGLWGYFSAFLYDLPLFILAPLGATNLDNVLLLTHTAGIVFLPLLFVLIDILLIEISWVKHFGWLPYPRYVKKIARLEKVVNRLQKYNAIPRPVRVARVYYVGVLAGIIHLLVFVYFGFL